MGYFCKILSDNEITIPVENKSKTENAITLLFQVIFCKYKKIDQTSLVLFKKYTRDIYLKYIAVIFSLSTFSNY